VAVVLPLAAEKVGQVDRAAGEEYGQRRQEDEGSHQPPRVNARHGETSVQVVEGRNVLLVF